MNCTECNNIRLRKNLVYDDKLVAAMLTEKPAAAGHLLLLPKEHATIIEQIPDETFEHMFSVANKLSVACFENLKAEGTNILIKNGVAAGQTMNHAAINIIPRLENDGLSMHWQTMKLADEELDSLQLMLKDALEKKEEIKVQEKEPIKEEEITDKEENYLIKQLERIP